MISNPFDFGLLVFLLFFAVGPAGMAICLWRLTRNAPPRWKLGLRIASVVLMCAAMLILAFLVLVVFLGSLAPA
jgi:hypothetical protein